MKKLITTVALLISATYLFAQCKPDIEKADKITKEKMKAWEYELYVTPLSGSMGGADEFGVNVIIGKTGDKYELDIQITKYEFNETKANFESKIQGGKGSTVLFGFKEGGTPLTFTATEVQNASKAMKSFVSGKEMFVTKITMACYYSKEEIMAFKEALSTKTIDAFRAKLNDGMMLERSIKEKRGEKMKEKFNCFFNDLVGVSQTGNMVTPNTNFKSTDATASVDNCNKYLKMKKTGKILILSGGGAFVLGSVIAIAGGLSDDFEATTAGNVLQVFGFIGASAGFVLKGFGKGMYKNNNCAMILKLHSNGIGLAYNF